MNTLLPYPRTQALQDNNCWTEKNGLQEDVEANTSKPHRARVESMNETQSSLTAKKMQRKDQQQHNGSVGSYLQRTKSCPNLLASRNRTRNIFHDISPRLLRIQEVKSWTLPWSQNNEQVSDQTKSKPIHVETIDINYETSIDQITQALEKELGHLDINDAASAGSSPKVLSTSNRKTSRPQLKLRLEDMPTPQEAENRAQKAANRLFARCEGENTSTKHKRLSLSLKPCSSMSSGDEQELLSPGERLSVGSQWSPNHGRFTTKTVIVSEAGISSPESTYLHLQHDLVRVREVGRGACGVVHKAIHVPTLKVVAVKDVPVYGKGQKRQMVRELHALYSNLVPISDTPTSEDKRSSSSSTTKKKAKANPFIVSFYDAFVDKMRNCVCLVMEFMGAGSLQDIVLAGGCSNEILLSRMAFCVLNGLAHIHKNHLIHRDIKPHNLLMSRGGDVKVSDFGLARTLNANVNNTKTFVGTLLYMAPERIGGGNYSYAADIWSFGLSLMAVALGKYALPTEDGFFGLVDSIADEDCLRLPDDENFSPDCRDFIEKCLQINPENRPTANALLEHPFVTKYDQKANLPQWRAFAMEKNLTEPAQDELASLSKAVYQHVYDNATKFSVHTQSEFGNSMLSQGALPITKRHMTVIQPIEKSLQLGLAFDLGLPPEQVYDAFETQRMYFQGKLLEKHCFSPQSWTASPGLARRHQLLGSDGDDSPVSSLSTNTTRRHSLWRKLHETIKKFGTSSATKKKRSKLKSSGGQL